MSTMVAGCPGRSAWRKSAGSPIREISAMPRHVVVSGRTHMRYAQEPPHEAIIHSANIEHSEVDLAHDFERIHERNRDVL
jgi:hypothetical protein